MVKITVPATSANLGAGFDSLGLALAYYNQVEMSEDQGVHIFSEDGVAIPTDESNLIYQTAKSLYEKCGKPFCGLRIVQRNRIPLARGLGSSSACITAGLLGANALLGSPLTRQELVNMAAVMEGHPDNTTPAFMGGMVTAAIENGQVYAVKQQLPNDIQFAAIVPDFELKTADARAALPSQVAHKDGVYNLSRAALMAVSLCTGHYENLRPAVEDRLHQPYRIGLIAHGRETVDQCYQLGAYAAYISGAGSTLMAILPRGNDSFVPQMANWLRERGLSGWRILLLEGDNDGAKVEQE